MKKPSKPDLSEIDNRIKNLLPAAKLQEGIKFYRWAVLDQEESLDKAKELKKMLNAEGFFIGNIMGKSKTVFFLELSKEFNENI